MRIENCLIVTTDQSRIDMRPDEMSDFSGNLVLNENLLENDSDALIRWREVRQDQEK